MPYLQERQPQSRAVFPQPLHGDPCAPGTSHHYIARSLAQAHEWLSASKGCTYPLMLCMLCMMTQETPPGPALPAKQHLKRCSLGAGTQAGDVERGRGKPLHLDLELLRFHPNLHSYYLCDLREATSHNLVSFS